MSAFSRQRSRTALTARPTPVSRQLRVRLPSGQSADWGIAEETPVEIGFNGQAWTVMMATPASLDDLAAGLALTEGAVAEAADIDAIEIRQWPEGITADIKIAPDKLAFDRVRRRSLDGRTGCGLCGVETLADLHRPNLPRTSGLAIANAAIRAAFDALPDYQSLNRDTRSVHVAAWCSPDGSIELVREDVGRHNALDKLAGAKLRADSADDGGFVIMSSRCSFELVFKAARMRASVLATLSAPTGLALDLATALDLPLASPGPSGQIILFSGEK
jgi:FdhD protein